MEGEEPEEPEEGGGPEESASTEPSAKPKSKSPTPEVLGSETARSKSPTPGVAESKKSKSNSPTPEVLRFDRSMSRSPTPEIRDSALKMTKSVTPEVTDTIKSKSKSTTPEVPEYVTLQSESKSSMHPPVPSSKSKSSTTLVKPPEPVILAADSAHASYTPDFPESFTVSIMPSPKSKSPTPDPLRSTFQSSKFEIPSGSKSTPKESKSVSSELPESSKNKSQSPDSFKSSLQNSKSMISERPDYFKNKSGSPDIADSPIPKSKSLIPESTDATTHHSETKIPHGLLSTTSLASKTVRIRSVSEFPPPEIPDTFIPQSKSTQIPDVISNLAFNSVSTQTPVGSDPSASRLGNTGSVQLTKSKGSILDQSDLSKSKSKLLIREVSFAENYKSVGQKSQMTELRTSILSGGTASTTNSGTTKVAADGRTGPVFRGGSLAVFRGAGPGGILQSGNIQGIASSLLQKRSPFIHNPPQPEERRPRIASPRTPKEYIINLREDLADFQESHGLPRTRDYSFVSLGLALVQETGRAIYSLFQMFTELFPILAIVSLILRFALDKIIEILETTETVPKIKKSVVFALEMIAIVIPLWIFIGTIVIPLVSLILSIFKKMIRFRGGKKKSPLKIKAKPCAKGETCSSGPK